MKADEAGRAGHKNGLVHPTVPSRPCSISPATASARFDAVATVNCALASDRAFCRSESPAASQSAAGEARGMPGGKVMDLVADNPRPRQVEFHALGRRYNHAGLRLSPWMICQPQRLASLTMIGASQYGVEVTAGTANSSDIAACTASKPFQS